MAKVHRPSGVDGGDKLIVESGGELDIKSGATLKMHGTEMKIARGVAADVTATEEITSGLSTVVSVVACLANDPAVGEAMWVTVEIPTQTAADAGKFTAKTWKPTANDNATPTAGTGEHDVAWIAIGT